VSVHSLAGAGLLSFIVGTPTPQSVDTVGEHPGRPRRVTVAAGWQMHTVQIARRHELMYPLPRKMKFRCGSGDRQNLPPGH